MGNTYTTETEAVKIIPNTNSAPANSEDPNEQQIMIPTTISKKEIAEYFGDNFPIVISPQVFAIRDEVTQIRRYFHQNPELSLHEVNTATSIVEYLKDLNINTSVGMAEKGVIGLLSGAYDGPCIMLRASMDALPIHESKQELNKEFYSINKGVMHANGNDAQMAILCATAKILSKLKHLLHGSIKFVFQPSKENGKGAAQMIEEQVLQNPRADQVYGMQLLTDDYCGECRVISNAFPFMAGNVSFEIILEGKGGHAAHPHGTHDSIVAVSHLCQQLYSVINRNIDPLKSCVLNVGSIHSNGRSNVIASHAKICGCIRWFNKTQLDIVLKRIHQICNGIENSFEVKIEMKIISETPPVVNRNRECNDLVIKTVHQILPKSQNTGLIHNNSYQTTLFDDFGLYMNERPGCLFLLGCGIKSNDDTKEKENPVSCYPQNSSMFCIDERCLTVGVQIMTTLVLERLVNWKKTSTQDINNQNMEL